eukprot:SAG31_NODE_16263_length_716_cov_1.132901_1_plen_29_part_10
MQRGRTWRKCGRKTFLVGTHLPAWDVLHF